VPVVRPLLLALTSFLRMTPPLLQLYLVFFGLGGLVAAYGFTLNAFVVAVVVLSAYAGAANAVSFAEAADVAARGGGRLAFGGRDIARTLRLSYPALVGSAVNIVKATGMASMIAVPELVHASTAIIAENGNPAVMMNILLACYVALIFVIVRLFSMIQSRMLSR
jgi:polar amino acid transport system substrate-binding protein